MTFSRGELLTAVGGTTTVWAEGLSRGLDVIQIDDLVMVVESTDVQGWTQVMTRRGIRGYVHRSNLQRPLVQG